MPRLCLRDYPPGSESSLTWGLIGAFWPLRLIQQLSWVHAHGGTRGHPPVPACGGPQHSRSLAAGPGAQPEQPPHGGEARAPPGEQSTLAQAAGGLGPWHGRRYQLQLEHLSSDILTSMSNGCQEAWAARHSLSTMPRPPGPASSQTGVCQPAVGPGRKLWAQERPPRGGQKKRTKEVRPWVDKLIANSLGEAVCLVTTNCS